MIVRTILISAAALLVALPAEAKTTKLKTAVSKAQFIIGRDGATAETAESVLTSEKCFAGKFSATINVKAYEVAGATATIRGTVRVVRGSKSRYRTDEERSSIADLNAQIKGGREAMEQAIKSVRASDAYNDTVGGGGGLLGAKKRLNALGKSRIREIKLEFATESAKLKKLLIERNKEVMKAEKARRAACESVDVTVTIPADKIPRSLADKMSDEKLRKMSVMVSVKGFKVGNEPKELGGSPRISAMDLTGHSVIQKKGSAVAAK